MRPITCIKNQRCLYLWAFTLDAKRAAPSDELRIITASVPIAETVSNVSRRLSPFVIELPLFVILTTSAPKYLPASSKAARPGGSLGKYGNNRFPFKIILFLFPDNTILFHLCRHIKHPFNLFSFKIFPALKLIGLVAKLYPFRPP